MTPTEMLARLVAFDSVSRHSNLPLIDFIEDWLQQHGAHCTRIYDDSGQKCNLLARLGPEVPDGVVLSGHTDVVPVEGQHWSSDPFCLEQRDGRLYGRGTTDMKGFVALCLALVPEMTALKRPIILALSYDEEVGCLGAPRMIDHLCQHLPRPEAVIVGEPSCMVPLTAHKGIMDLRTYLHGRPGHSSQTHRGVSAIGHAGALMQWIQARAELEATRTTPLRCEPPYTTLQVGRISGGTAVNIIAADCELHWDLRLAPGHDGPALLEEFEAYCAQQRQIMCQRAPEAEIVTQVLANVPPFEGDEHGPATQLAQALSGHTHCVHAAYASEAGQFQQAGLPTVICGPGDIAQAHQPDEFISLEQFTAGEAFIRRLIARLSA